MVAPHQSNSPFENKPFPRVPSLSATARLAAFGVSSILWFAPPQATADLVTYFNFNDATPLQSDAGQSVTISGTVANTSSSPGTSENALFGDPPGQDLTLFVGINGENNGKWIQFSFSTAGLADITLSYATLSSAQGFSTQSLSYSVNSGSFVDFGSVTPPQNAFAVRSFDLASVGAIENQPSVTFRLTFAGASTTNFFESNRFDNIQVVAVPEPGTGLLGGVTGLALFLNSRRRHPFRAGK